MRLLARRDISLRSRADIFLRANADNRCRCARSAALPLHAAIALLPFTGPFESAVQDYNTRTTRYLNGSDFVSEIVEPPRARPQRRGALVLGRQFTLAEQVSNQVAVEGLDSRL